MQSALIVHSRHTKAYAYQVSREYRDVTFLEIVRPPTEDVLTIRHDKDVVIGIGGGSVIDTAKIISRNKSCIAMPTTAAGAAMTPYATVWGERKTSIPTEKPILELVREPPWLFSGMLKDLPLHVLQSTMFDAWSHAIESFWSQNATFWSRKYSRKAIGLIDEYLNSRDINTLIDAGNLAGQAIAIAGTNVVHATSYPITLRYAIDHGTTCGMLLHHFVQYMDFEGLPKLFSFDSTEALSMFLKSHFVAPKVVTEVEWGTDADLIAERALEYNKINRGPKRIDRRGLVGILKGVVNGRRGS